MVMADFKGRLVFLALLLPIVLTASDRQITDPQTEDLPGLRELGVDVSRVVTPPTPSPGDANCWINVPTTELRGGKCVRLGTTSSNYLYGCRAGIHLQLTEDCAPQTDSPNPTRRSRGRGGSSRRGRGGGRGSRRGGK